MSEAFRRRALIRFYYYRARVRDWWHRVVCRVRGHLWVRTITAVDWETDGFGLQGRITGQHRGCRRCGTTDQTPPWRVE